MSLPTSPAIPHHPSASRSTTSDVRAMASRSHPRVLTIAHRGVWTPTAENSLASIEAAIARGVDMVEIDTQATADGQLVVVHDQTLDRTTTGTGVVADLPFRTVRDARLKAGAGGDGADITPEVVPTLEEVLETARGRIAVNIDTKFPRDLPRVVQTVLDLGVEAGVLLKTTIDPDAPTHAVLEAGWCERIPHMPMFRVRPGRFAQDLRRIAPLRAPMVEVGFEAVADIAAARAELERQDIRVWVNTLDVSHNLDYNDSRACADPQAVWGRLLEAGVGAIQTDAVDALMTWLDRDNAQGESK